MKPYYSDDLVTLYHGDCRDVLPTLGRFDLLLTDPPYGIGHSGQASTIRRNPRHNRKLHADAGWDERRPGAEVFALMFAATDNQMIWGGNYFTEFLPASKGWIVWDKGQDFSSSDCELAYTSYQKPLRRIVCNRKQIDLEGACHPAQKPLKVVQFCLTYAGGSGTVLDPFAGSGSVLRGAKDVGRKSLGVEIEESYCEIAAQRLSQEILSFGDVA